MNWRKIWRFLWKDDSLASWAVNVVLAIVLVKFVIFPILGFVLSTSFPVVAVVSCSMEHGITDCGNGGQPLLCGESVVSANNFDEYWNICGDWYSSLDIDKEMFQDFSFKNGFNKGDIMVLYGSRPENVNLGDVIVFNNNGRDPIIHRVVDKNFENEKIFFHTKGDHNSDSIRGFNTFGGIVFDETRISEDDLLGKAVFRIPYLGWIKVVFSQLIGGVLR
jgi:signal peptidase I